VRPWRRAAARVGIGAVVVLLALQLIPYGRDHSNPPVTAGAPWPDPDSRRIAVAACYDCHSNETDWPFYSSVAPASWLVTKDVDAGRHELNFSEWDRHQDAGDAADALADGSMPPGRYTALHRDARLSAVERDALLAALRAMEEGDDRGRGGGERGGD
jgi:hypothetical protein